MKKFLLSIMGISFCLASYSSFAEGKFIWKQNYHTDTYNSLDRTYFYDCVGGSSTDSTVGSWRCQDSNRYKWEFVPSSISGWYLIKNSHNGRCLSRYSKKNKMRYYTNCSESDFRLWRFQDRWGNLISPQRMVDGGEYRLELKKSHAGCLSTRLNDWYYSTTYRQGKLSTQSCNEEVDWSYPVEERLFKIGGTPYFD